MASFIAASLPPGIPYNEIIKVMAKHGVQLSRVSPEINDLSQFLENLEQKATSKEDAAPIESQIQQDKYDGVSMDAFGDSRFVSGPSAELQKSGRGLMTTQDQTWFGRSFGSEFGPPRLLSALEIEDALKTQVVEEEDLIFYQQKTSPPLLPLFSTQEIKQDFHVSEFAFVDQNAAADPEKKDPPPATLSLFSTQKIKQFGRAEDVIVNLKRAVVLQKEASPLIFPHLSAAPEINQDFYDSVDALVDQNVAADPKKKPPPPSRIPLFSTQKMKQEFVYSEVLMGQKAIAGLEKIPPPPSIFPLFPFGDGQKIKRESSGSGHFAPDQKTAADLMEESDEEANGSAKLSDLEEEMDERRILEVDSEDAGVLPKMHFKCEFCGKRANTRYSLDRHYRIHAIEMPYECTICQKRFKALANFNRHKNLHVEEKAVVYGHAKPSFNWRADVEKHRVVVKPIPKTEPTPSLHKDQRYKCTDCNLEIAHFGYLLMHFKKVHGLDPMTTWKRMHGRE